MSFDDALAAALARALEPLRAEIAQLRAKLDERTPDRAAGQLVTLEAAAKSLGVSKRHLTGLVAAGAIPIVRLGTRAVRVDLAAVRAALEAHAAKGELTDAAIIAAARRAAPPGEQV